MTALDHAVSFISLLHPTPAADALIEISGLARKATPVKCYFQRIDHAAERALEINAMGYNIFVNVNPRNAMASFESNVSVVTALALDLQGEKVPFNEIEARLISAQLYPTSIVVSGYGAHMYFAVEAADPIKAKIVAERLIKFTGSDPIQNTNRIMRLPGTWNLKDRNNPKPCYVVGIWPERRYTIAEVDRCLSRVGAPVARPPKEGIPVPLDPNENWLDIRHRLDAGTLDIIDSGERNAYSARQVTRSEADWVVICALVRAGVSDEMIEWIYETQPVGIMKYREAGAGYLHRTIREARRETALPKTPTAAAHSYGHVGYSGRASDNRRAATNRR